MNEFCLALLTNLLRTTAYLSAAAIVVGVLLKISHCQSPRVHRVAWCLVLLQGLLFVRIPWSIAWLPRPAPVVNRTDDLPRLDEPLILPVDPLAKFSAPPPNEEAISVAPHPVAPEQTSQPSIIAGLRNHWPILAALFWLGGMFAVAGVWIFRYVRFLRTVPAGEQGDAQWQQEFAAVLGKSNRSAAIHLRITDDAGPLVCRRSGSYSLLVPRPLWESLSAAERHAILRHEIGHYRRGDLWKSIGVRLLALPHWFNLFAWLAVRRFDEAAEWACDELATGSDVPATEYANVLLKVCESIKHHGAIAPAAGGSSVARRIRRLLSTPETGDSSMRKLMVCGIATLLLISGVFKLQLAAEETGKQAQPSKDAKALVKEANDAYQFAVYQEQGEHNTYDNLYLWSRRILQAELAVAASAEAKLAAYRAHLERMKVEYEITYVLFKYGRRGGEAHNEAAGRFFLAEANLFVLQHSNDGKPAPDSAKAALKEAQSMAAAAKTAVAATRAAYDAGTVSLDQRYVWSKRLLQSILAIAPPKDHIIAYRDHRDEMQQIFNEVSAKHTVGAKGGEADRYAAARFYLAEADFLLSQHNDIADTKGKDENDAASAEGKALIAAANEAYLATESEYFSDRATADSVYSWSKRWLQAILDAGEKPAISVAYREHYERMKRLSDAIMNFPNKSAFETRLAAQYFLTEADILAAQHADDGSVAPKSR